MEQATVFKITAAGAGAMIASFILFIFNVPPEAFLAGLICAVIGEFAKKDGDFKSAVLAVVAVTILTGYFGKVLIDHFKDTSPTSICAIAGFVMTYYRTTALDLGAQILVGFKDFVIDFFRRGGKSG